MPRYTYECTKCGHSYEKLEGWDAKARQRCPECRAVSLRIPMAPMIVFKGSGFYSTDNKRSLRQGSSGGDEDGSSDGESEGASTSDDSGSDSSGSDSDNGNGSGKASSNDSKKSSKSGSKAGGKSARL